MGVDTVIRLPADVRVRDAAEVIGILLGQPKQWHKSNRDAQMMRGWVVVEGVTREGIAAVPECARIKAGEREFTWHFEGGQGMRLLMPRSTPSNLALGRALVDFFGGEVKYQDCQGGRKDYRAHRPRPRNDPEDGAEWDAFQRAIYLVEPLTTEAIKQVGQYAAYQEAE